MPTATMRFLRPELERLEDRLTPSAAAPDLNLSTSGAAGQLNGAIFRQIDSLPPGPGTLDTFVRLQSQGKATVTQGFNTNGTLQFDENKGKSHTHAIQLGDVPEVVLDGVRYREFVLDINQKTAKPLVSLDELRLFVGASGSLSGYNGQANTLAGLTAVYDLDAGADRWIQLNSSLNRNGAGDMVFLVRSELLGNDPKAYVYLFSRFGDHAAANGALEWSVAQHALTPSDPPHTDGSVIRGSVRDEEGNPLQDAIIFLDADGDGERDDTEAWTVTDFEGNYAFTNLASGQGAATTYTVRLIPPTGFVQVSSSPDPVSFDQPIDYLVVFDFVVRPEEGPAPS